MLAPIEFSPSLLSRFDLPEKIDDRHPYSYSDLFIGERTNVLLFRRIHSDRGESFSDTCLVVNGKCLKATIQERPQCNDKNAIVAPTAIRLQAFVPLLKNDLSKIRRITKQICPSYFGFRKDSVVLFKAVDETRPKRPRSVTKLRKYMNRFASRIDRNSFLQAMEFFVPFVVSGEEAKLFHVYIQQNGGKGLTDKAVLLFELGFEKCKDKTNS